MEPADDLRQDQRVNEGIELIDCKHAALRQGHGDSRKHLDEGASAVALQEPWHLCMQPRVFEERCGTLRRVLDAHALHADIDAAQLLIEPSEHVRMLDE